MDKKTNINLHQSLENMISLDEKIKGEKITCGNCAAYPCHRRHTSNDPAGMCYEEFVADYTFVRN